MNCKHRLASFALQKKDENEWVGGWAANRVKDKAGFIFHSPIFPVPNLSTKAFPFIIPIRDPLSLEAKGGFGVENVVAHGL